MTLRIRLHPEHIQFCIPDSISVRFKGEATYQNLESDSTKLRGGGGGVGNNLGPALKFSSNSQLWGFKTSQGKMGRLPSDKDPFEGGHALRD